MSILTLNLPDPPQLEKRDINLNQAGVSLSAGLAALGYGSYVDSNENVTEHTALTVSTYLTCLRIISESVASLPARVYEKLQRGQRPAPDHYLYYLLTQRPNPQETAKTFFQTLMIHACGWSNGYARIERDAQNRPKALWHLLPWKTKPVREKGVLSYVTTDTGNGLPVKIDADDMIHIRGFSLNGLEGTPLVRFARQTLGLAMVAERFGARFYANGARNSFFLQPDHDLSPEEMTDMKANVEALGSGANSFRVGALPVGLNIVTVEGDPNALEQYIETSKLTIAQIASFMRIPLYMLGVADKTLKATVEAQNREFLTYTIQPWLNEIEQELQYKLLPPVGRAAGQYTIRYYVDALLAADTQTLTTKLQSGRLSGYYSANDCREILGMEPIPGGDAYLVPLNTTPAAQAAEGVETANDPEDVSPNQQDGKDVDAKRATALYQPIFADAFNRLQNRTKQDLTTITQTITPVALGLGSYFRTSVTRGTRETEALDKYLRGLETRVSKTPQEVEFQKLLRTIVYAVQSDAAESRAKDILNEHE